MCIQFCAIDPHEGRNVMHKSWVRHIRKNSKIKKLSSAMQKRCKKSKRCLNVEILFICINNILRLNKNNNFELKVQICRLKSSVQD
jgi:hypothetical protein